MKRRIKLSLILLLVASLLFIFASCAEKPKQPLTKEELSSAVLAETDKDEDYVTNYLSKWNMPTFTKSKMKGIELVYRDYYVKDIPDAYTLAVGTANLFLEHFYDDIDLTDEVAVTDGLIICYVEMIGDTYSFYRTAEEYEDYDTDMSGTFAGIGVVVQYSYIDETMTVTALTIGAGAEEAGILVGDIITKADGVSIKELGYQKTISAIRGEVGTRVEITVERDGVELTFDIERKQIVEDTVTYSLGTDKIGYIRITDFKDITFSQFKTAIKYMEEGGAVGIIYDLRANPGGYLASVVDILSYIAPKGTTIVSFNDGYAEPIKCTEKHTVTLPSVVLCDENTASAGELFTAAMRDFGNMGFFPTMIVGEVTYGKGVMQNSYTFTDGSAITLTVAYYNPPSGVNYDGVGITPDIHAEMTSTGDAQLEAANAAIKALINK